MTEKQKLKKAYRKIQKERDKSNDAELDKILADMNRKIRKEKQKAYWRQVNETLQ